MKLSDNEILALRRMPEFKRALAHVKAEQERARAAEEAESRRRHTSCDGGGILGSDVGYQCVKCGLLLKFKDWSTKDRILEILTQRHWQHLEGGNPARKDGMYGKAAAAADGDWYGSH